VERFWEHGPRLRPQEVIAEFERTIMDELDLMREVANASQLRRNFSHSDLLYIPEVNWEYARQSVVMFERIYGIPISDVAKLRQQGFDLKKLAERGVEIFFTQVFRDSFFHADMHPGNIFVAPRDPKNPQYIGVDFGIMGSISPQDQHYLAENLLAFFKRDYRRVAMLHVQSGWVPPDTRIEEFEGTIRAVCEPIFERPLKDISFGQLLLRLFQTARRYHMQVQPQLLLLQKTLLNIEGLGRELYPDLDLWVTAKPFLERWMRQQTGPQAFWKKFKERSPFWWEKIAEIPDLVYEALQKNSPLYANQHPVYATKTKVTISKQTKSTNLLKGFFLGLGAALFLLAGINTLFISEAWQFSSGYNFVMLLAGTAFILLGSISKNKKN
jgi:ubiquinone biosynthesis protein